MIGRNIAYGIGMEGTRGAGTGSDLTSWFEKTGGSFNDRFDTVDDNGSVGSIVSMNDTHKVFEFADGGFEGFLKINTVGYFLYNLLGKKVTTNPETGVYQHVFSLLESNSHASLVIGRVDDISSKVYSLAMVKSMEITAEIGKIATIKVDVESKPGTVETIEADYTLDYTLLSRHGIFKYADTIGGLGAASTKCLRSFKIKIDQATEKRGCLGSTSPAEIFNKGLSISGSIEMDYLNDDIKTLVSNVSKKAIQFNMVDSNTDLGGGEHPTLDIKVNKVVFSNFDVSEGLDEISTQSFDFKALYDFGNKEVATITLVNTKTF